MKETVEKSKFYLCRFRNSDLNFYPKLAISILDPEHQNPHFLTKQRRHWTYQLDSQYTLATPEVIYLSESNILQYKLRKC